MRVLKNLSEKSVAMFASLALLIGIISVNSACFCWYHQPAVPQSMSKFKK